MKKMQRILFWQPQDGGPRTVEEAEVTKEGTLQMGEGLVTEESPEI